ncbi:ATP-binding protein [Halorarum halophilum]|uniref:histidine kinase n=1 Tax=Halorarum halophilum TaxID=2743090 RepID=A0A7D5KUY0_9EURY|nr:ATP-binding protein [Halobaculum halophilum]QLG28120.1 ATP-binding protein [Halobaculum halophilum]
MMDQGGRYGAGVSLLAVPTVGLVGAATALLFRDSTTLLDFAFGWIAPVLLLGVLAYTVAWTRDQPITGDDVLVLGLWFAGGAVLFGLAALATYYFQIVKGGVIVDYQFGLINWSIGGGAIGLLVGNYDVHQHLTRRKLDRARQQASILNRVLRHDIRNDLNVVFGYLDRIEAASTEEREALAVVRDRAEHLHDVSERARMIEEAIRTEQLTTVDVAAAVRSHVEGLESDHPDAEIDLTGPERACVRAIEGIVPALWEPLENAVVHSDRPSPRVDVEISRSDDRADGQVVITIADAGPGFPELEEVVFGDDAESQLGHSRGTGLWLLKMTVEESGGHTSVSDAGGDGTLVTVRLPAAANPAES